MLAAVEENIVVSEADPVEGILRLRRLQPDLPEHEHADLIRALISALGQPRHGERRLFVKLEPWHTLELPLIRRVFPDVPFLFVYRDPLEILVSQALMPSGRIIPNPVDIALSGLDLITAVNLPEHEYRAHVVSLWFKALVDGTGPGSYLLNYTGLPDAVFRLARPVRDADFSEAELSAMRNACRFDAKNPDRMFSCDSDRKQAQATADLRRAAAVVTPYYERLEEQRTAAERASAASDPPLAPMRA